MVESNYGLSSTMVEFNQAEPIAWLKGAITFFLFASTSALFLNNDGFAFLPWLFKSCTYLRLEP